MRVSLFIPCTVDIFMPDIGAAVFSLLKRLGCEVVYHQEQTCCGQAHFNAGRRKDAAKLARRFISIFEHDDNIVCPSGSCVYMVKKHYPELFGGDVRWLKRAKRLGERVFELSEFIVSRLGIKDTDARFNGKVAYHESCHLLRGLGVTGYAKELISRVNGAQVVPLAGADSCCGFGGEFSNNYPEISGALVSDKVKNFIASGADVIILSEPGCLLNIMGYLHRHHPDKKAMHIANFLASQ
ncbi:MAG TPA: (Fe-S)-binding protein [Desulfomonilia bacterium]